MRSFRINQSNLLIIAAGVACLLTAVIPLLAMESAVDDAFIVYRYVDRFLEHKGLTYNDGEYVEGFTSLLWTLLLAAGSSIWGVKPPVISVCMNYTLILLTSLATIWLLQILRVRNVLKVICLFFKVVFLGLEFGLFTFLLMLTLCLFLRSIDYPDYRAPDMKASFMSGLLGTALFATRPEGVIVLPSFLLVTYLFRRQNRNIKSSLLVVGCSFVFSLILLIVWRLWYYGELLPNSVIAKAIPLSSAFAKEAAFSRKALLRDGITYLLEAYTGSPALLFTVLLAGLALWKKWRPFELLLIFMPIFWQHAIVLENGGDWMGYSRFITMFAPLFITNSLLVIEVVLQRSRTFGIVSLLVFCSLYILANAPYLTFVGKSHLGFFPDETDSYQSVAQVLNDVWLEGDILVSEATGRIAYFMPNAFTRDPAGLTDRTLARDQMARRSVFGRQNWHYSLSLKPAVIVLQYWPHQRTWSTFGFGYPEQFAFYCMPPIADVGQAQWLYIIIRADKDVRYGPPLVKLGALKLAYKDFQANYRACRPNG